jgi:hypothetical protein
LCALQQHGDLFGAALPDGRRLHHRLPIRQANRSPVSDDLDGAGIHGSRGVQHLREHSRMTEADQSIEVVLHDELRWRRRRGFRRRRRPGIERETSLARARRTRGLERQVVPRLRRQHGVAGRIAFGKHRQVHRLQHDAAADPRLLRDSAFHQNAVAEPRRRDRRTHIGLDGEEVEFALVFGQPAGH